MPTRPYKTDARRKRQTWAHKSTAKRIVAQHVATYGWVCPGWTHDPHPCTDLTADHIVPLARGGTNNPSNYRVMCRPGNSSRGAD